MKFFSGDMTASDYLANKDAVFHPAVDAADNNGSYAVPGMEVGGVLVMAYVRDGILVVSLDFDTTDISDAGPFAMYGDTQIPIQVTANGTPVWEALPEDAVTGADARQLRKTGDDKPVWVTPDWLDEKGTP